MNDTVMIRGIPHRYCDGCDDRCEWGPCPVFPKPVPKPVPDDGEFVLAGFLRFIESDTPGVVAEVVSIYKEGWAEDSAVPIYRRRGETKATMLT